MKRFLKRSAFTIVEMVIVIAVIGILATVMVPTISGMIERANKSADTQFAASLTIQLAMESVDGGIRNESDLRDAVNKYYGKWLDEGKTQLDPDGGDYYNEKLVPKAAKSGNYFWYHYDSGTVFAATVEDAPTEAAKLLSSPSMDASGGGASRSFSPASLRSDLIPGLYLMGCKPDGATGGELVDIISQFENLGNAEYFGGEVLDANLHYETAVNDLMAAADGNALMSALLAKVQKTTIVNEFGAFRHSSVETIDGVWVVAHEMTLSQTKVYVYENGTVGAGQSGKPLAGNSVTKIELPSSVKVALGGLPAIYVDTYLSTDLLHDYANTTQLHVNVENVADLESIYTDCVLVMPDGSRYVYIGEELFRAPITINAETGMPSDSSVGSVNTETMGSIDKIGITCPEATNSSKGQDKVYLYNNNLFVAYDKGTVQLALTEGVSDSMVVWSTSNSAVASVANGIVTVNLPEINGGIYTADITATYKYNPEVKETVTVFVARPVSAEIAVGENTITLNNDSDPGAFEISVKGEADLTQDIKVNGVESNDSGMVALESGTLTYDYDSEVGLFKIDGNVLTINADAISSVEKQTLKIAYTGANGVVYFERTYTVTVKDNRECPIKVNQINGVNMGEKYLFRVGNGNEFLLNKLFTGSTTKEVSLTIYDASKTEGPGKRTEISLKPTDGFYADYPRTFESGWDSNDGTNIRFYGTGVAIIEIKVGDKTAELAVEVVDGKNVTYTTTLNSTISNNIVLLENISLSSGSYTLENSTLWGNGFTIDVTGNHGTHFGIITMKNATIDNAELKGDTFTTVAFNGKDFYNALLYVYSGDCAVTNSYVYGCRTPIRMVGGTLLLDNTTLDDGAFANLWVESGDIVTLKDVITKKTKNLGMSIYLNNVSTVINIEGDFRQYNWISETEKNSISDTTIKAAAGVAFGLTDYVHTVDSDKYVNMGIIYAEPPEDGYLNDNRSEALKAAVVYRGGSSGQYDYYVYSYTTAKPVSDNREYFLYDQSMDDRTQSALEPSFTIDKNLNFDKNENDQKAYCVYNEKDGLFEVGVVSGDKFPFNLNMVTVSKYGFSLSESIEIKVNGAASSGTINFDKAGTYVITYSYEDNIIFDKNGERKDATISYEKKVAVKVSIIDAGTHEPTFTFNGTASKINKVGNVSYIMPNVSATNNKFGVTSDGVYYPIVSGAGYEYSGNGNEYARIFYIFGNNSSGVTITDYNGQTALTPYTEITTTMPETVKLESWSRIAGTSSPDNGKWAGAIPSPTTYSNKLCYEGKGHNHDKDIAEGTFLFKYSYQANNGTKYYYYVAYDCPAVSKKCITPDTLITLADGTQVRVDSLTGNEMLLVWNMETGKLDSAPIMFVDSEAEAELEVIKLWFSDGTEVKVIGEHGFWDYDLNKYVYLDNTASEYIGHWFAKQNGDALEKVQLVDVVIESEKTEAWSPVTAGHLCYFVNGMLSMPGGVGGLFNIFDVDAATMTYDYEAIARDIETYGLFTYEEMNAIVPLSEDMFNMAGGAYLKISIGKGNMTMDDLIYMIDRYSVYFN